MDIKEIWCGDVDWIQVAQDRVQLRALTNTVVTSIKGMELFYQQGEFGSVCSCLLLNKSCIFLLYTEDYSIISAFTDHISAWLQM
jgi:hypothetical protein